jgi:hypothetical protein
MLGFDLDIWDYITFVVVLIIAAGALAAAVSSLVCHAGSPLRGSTRTPRPSRSWDGQEGSWKS